MYFFLNSEFYIILLWNCFCNSRDEKSDGIWLNCKTFSSCSLKINRTRTEQTITENLQYTYYVHPINCKKNLQQNKTWRAESYQKKNVQVKLIFN